MNQQQSFADDGALEAGVLVAVVLPAQAPTTIAKTAAKIVKREPMSRPIAFIVTKKNVAANVPRLSFAVIDASVSSSPCSFNRRASSA